MLHHIYDEETIKDRLRQLLGPKYPDKVLIRPRDIRELRNEKKFTQAYVERETGISQSNLSRYESEEPTYRNTVAVYSLATLLGVELSRITRLPLHISGGWSVEEQNHFASQLESVAMVKTLAKPGEDADLRSFYHPTSLRHVVDEEEVSHEFDSLEDFDGRPALIQGVAGQGKSIFLRYLALQTLGSMKTMPILVELRQLRNQSITQAILYRLQQLKCEVDEQRLDYLLETGALALLLDGFDELSVDARSRILSEIEELRDRFEHVQIVITSRPQTGVAMLSWVKVYEMSPLSQKEISKVVELYAGNEEATNILERLRSASVSINGLLTTPLMVLLLVVHFRYSRSVPTSTIAFYKDLLDVLLRRHNLTEAGFKREIESGLDTLELRHFFQSLCFICERDFSDEDIHRSDLEDAAIRALKAVGLNASAIAAVDDVAKVTNLIVEEGGFCRFIHKSVKEFYASAFIAAASDNNAQKFYERLSRKWRSWKGEISFLSEIDRNRCIRWFLLPDLERAKPFSGENLFLSYPAITISDLKREKKRLVVMAECQSFCMPENMVLEIGNRTHELSSFFEGDLLKYVLASLNDNSTDNPRVKIDRRSVIDSVGLPDWDEPSPEFLMPFSAIAKQLDERHSSFIKELTEDDMRSSEFEI